jgi:hypothetical protein
MPSYEGFEKCVSLCETRSPVNVFKRYSAVTWFPYCQFSFRCLSHGARRFDLIDSCFGRVVRGELGGYCRRDRSSDYDRNG